MKKVNGLIVLGELMIIYVKGDYFNSSAQVLTNTVNTEGVMGKGLALEFKKKYPQMYKTYKEKCESGAFGIGNLMLCKEHGHSVLLFPTKTSWRKKSELEYIEAGLIKFAKNWDKLGITSIAFPKLGCGLGGLEWNIVKPLMEKYLSRLPITVYIYTDFWAEKKEESSLTDIEKWLNGTNGLIGYEKFKHDIINYFDKNGNRVKLNNYEFIYSDGLTINGIRYEESDIVRCWAYIKNVKMISEDEINDSNNLILGAILELMLSINFVSKIYISKDGLNYTNNPNGYHYIAA